MDEQRALLASLMGESDPHENDPGKGKHFDDDDVCKPYLVGCCPGELFHNTKLDRGGCGKIHSEYLKGKYDQADQDYGYERLTLEVIEASVRDCDRKIVKTKPRDGLDTKTIATNNLEEITELQKKIDIHRAEVDEFEKVDDLANIEAAKEHIENCKIRISELKEGSRRISYDISKPMTMVMCEICGSILHEEEVNQDSRHYRGRTHKAFATMRDYIPIIRQRLLHKQNMPVAPRRRSRSRSREHRRRRRSYSSSSSSDSESRSPSPSPAKPSRSHSDSRKKRRNDDKKNKMKKKKDEEDDSSSEEEKVERKKKKNRDDSADVDRKKKKVREDTPDRKRKNKKKARDVSSDHDRKKKSKKHESDEEQVRRSKKKSRRSRRDESSSEESESDSD